jgi:hypothetical protein
MIDVSPVAMLVVNDINGVVFVSHAAANLYGTAAWVTVTLPR